MIESLWREQKISRVFLFVVSLSDLNFKSSLDNVA